jgi:hypothetical protein
MNEEKTPRSRPTERPKRGEPEARAVPAKRGNGFASLADVWQGRASVGDDFDELPADLGEALGITS